MALVIYVQRDLQHRFNGEFRATKEVTKILKND